MSSVLGHGLRDAKFDVSPTKYKKLDKTCGQNVSLCLHYLCLILFHVPRCRIRTNMYSKQKIAGRP